jgi:hypothetical protein
MAVPSMVVALLEIGHCGKSLSVAEKTTAQVPSRNVFMLVS